MYNKKETILDLFKEYGRIERSCYFLEQYLETKSLCSERNYYGNILQHNLLYLLKLRDEIYKELL